MTAVAFRPATGRGRRLPVAAAVGYVVAWTAGLSVFSSSTQVRESGADVVAALSGHRVPVTLQYVLTEGVTTVLLVIAVWPLWRSCREPAVRAMLRVATAAAAVTAFVELGLGVHLAGGLTPAAAGTVNDVINRLDGVKMLLLALTFAAAALAVRRGSLPAPTWFAGLAAATALTLTVSGAGYVTLDSRLATAAWVSLPALIAAVVAAGVISRSAGRRSGCA